MSERPSIQTDSESRIEDTSRLLDATGLLESEKIRTRINLINEEIKRCLLDEDGEPAILYETTRHLIFAGGKRLRSLLLILCCEAVGGTVVNALPFAVATEFVQTASLIHDDVVDEDNLRRGVETTHKKFGRKMAIIAGDLLVALAIKLIGERSNPELLTYVAVGGIKMCEGEAADLLMSKNKIHSYTTETALEIIKMKTVSFMTSAAKVGAMLGKANQTQLEALINYSEMLGFSFQIRDDILDIVATHNGTGKTVLSDLRGSRSNYVLAHAIESCSSKQKEEYVQKLNEGDSNFALALISEHKSVEHSTEIAKKYMLAAKEAIRGFDFANEELLLQLADFAMQRLH
ncbi:polyprenyl synthetase family protein [Candidatus Thorarchaeota archaeon]|nr:MAG: polyprenyl synthetase family protein [Candidatus Thorarchaeota archaeon]